MSSSSSIAEFYKRSSPYSIIFTKNIVTKYPTQVLLSIFKTHLSSIVVPNTLHFNLSKKMIVLDLIFSRDKIYKKLYLNSIMKIRALKIK